MNIHKLLIVDDEQDMRMLIRSFLVAEGYQVLEASNGAEALMLLEKNAPDLILADVMMPFMDGYALIEEVRKTRDVPVIVLSAKGEEWDKVKGLKLGADDYIAKPFHSAELIARIETVLRRTDPKRRKSNLLQAGVFSIDQKNHRAFAGENEISLTMKEFQLLAVLVQHPKNVLSRRILLEMVWGMDYEGTERTVDTHIKTLRLKLGDKGEAIKTVWGVGYKLEV